MRYRPQLATALVLTVLAVLFSSLQANDLPQQRWERRQQQLVKQPVPTEVVEAAIESPVSFGKSVASAVVDTKVNKDDGAASFAQRFNDVVYCPDGKGVVVWEDERNGVWEIYAQQLTSDGLPSGTNTRLVSNATYHSSRQPRLAANASSKIMIVWTEEETGSILAKVISSSLSSLTGVVKVNDNTGTNVVNLPAVTAIATGEFVIVWEDTRDGANIYGQIIADGANRIGSNFRVNSNVSSPYRIAPDISASNDTTFAVVWEDSRSGSGHCYFRILKNDGTPLSADLALESAHPTAYQFSPQVRFCKGSGYYTAWISNRYAGQSVYGQMISASAVPIDTSIRINALLSDICWDLRLGASKDSGVGCVWSDYTTTAQIKYQKITKSGGLSGDNVTAQDNSLLGERNFPAVAFRNNGVNVVWTDERNGNSDIFQQRLDASAAKSMQNLILNDDAVGSQQYTPDIAWLPQGSSAIVWRDCQLDAGDIMLQRTTFLGVLTGSVIRVNDDPGRSLQANPRIGTALSGEMTIVWEDSRTATGVAGQNIFLQRLSANGTKLGSNIVVNDDGTSRPKSDPDIAVTNNGSSVVVWTDQRNSKKQIYFQRYNSAGVAIGSNQLVTGITGVDDCFEPRVGMRADGSFVICYLAIAGGNQELFFQRYDNSGVAVGSLTMLDVDSSQVAITDADIFVHESKGDFYIASIQQSASGSAVKWHRYDFAGNVALSNVLVSDVTGVDFDELETKGDIDDGIVVTWSDSRSGLRRAYFQLLRQDGYHLNMNTPLSTGSSPYLERHPAVSLNNGFVFCTWVDNRNAGRGFDVFLNSDQYTSTDVEDHDVDLPRQFELEQNFPNPFNPETAIRYELRASQPVKLTIFNALGQEVRTLIDEFQAAGVHSVVWDGRSAAGTAVASGVYFYRLQAGSYSETRKMALLK